MDARLAVDPEQPPEVVEALGALLADERPVDPWWRAGNEQALAADPRAACSV